MKYYVTADVHGYFTELKTALAEQGFFDDTDPHKLVILGDLYDRGTEALQLQDFILDLMSKDQVILIRGNHEDLTLDLLHNWSRKSYLQRHHNLNGTVDTVCQLTGFSEREIYTKTDAVGQSFLQNSLVQTIIPALVDYFETEHYSCVHGWIPCTPISLSSTGSGSSNSSGSGGNAENFLQGVNELGQLQNSQFLNLLNQSSDLFRCHDKILLKYVLS